MLNNIEKSIKHFFEDILKEKITEDDNISGELYGSSIVLSSESEGDYEFYLFFPKEVFEKFRQIFLKNAVFKEDDFCDLAKECANEIIGYAKVKLNENKKEYSLGIPEYLGRVDFANFKLDEEFTYSMQGCNFRIGYKKA